MAETEKLTGAQISKIIDTYDNSQYLTNDKYYKGNNPTLLDKDFDGTPDNRVPLPFARKTVTDIMGYAYKPGYVNYVFDTEEENSEEQVEKIKEIFKENNENLKSAEVFQDALIKGEGAELIYWEGGDSVPKFTKIPREQVIFIYDDSVEDKLKYSIRYYTSKIIGPDGTTEKIDHADVYYKDVIHFYEQRKRDSMATVDPQDEVQGTTTDRYNSYQLVREEPHFFGDIPLYPYEINSDKLGVFQPAIKIIDAMDDMSSDSILNALGQFNSTILALSKRLTDETIEKIKEKRVMDDLGGREEGNFVEYIQRQIDLNSTVEGFSVYERLYYDLTGIPNFNDEKFYTQKSGIAMMYALIPFENLISTFEVYFNNGLKYRLSLINNLYEYDVKATIEWKRNVPEDVMSKINELVTLKREGLISTETALNRLPMELVEDAELELEKVNKEKEENMKMFESQLDEPEDQEETDEDKEQPKDEE